VALLFVVNGLIIGGCGGVLPSIRVRLDIDAAHVAILLFTAGLAGMRRKGRSTCPVILATRSHPGRQGSVVL
jgi:hypothetical protein